MTDPKVKQALLDLVDVCRMLNEELAKTSDRILSLSRRVLKLEKEKHEHRIEGSRS
jgi:hypothetical protein